MKKFILGLGVLLTTAVGYSQQYPIGSQAINCPTVIVCTSQASRGPTCLGTGTTASSFSIINKGNVVGRFNFIGAISHVSFPGYPTVLDAAECKYFNTSVSAAAVNARAIVDHSRWVGPPTLLTCDSQDTHECGLSKTTIN